MEDDLSHLDPIICYDSIFVQALNGSQCPKQMRLQDLKIRSTLGGSRLGKFRFLGCEEALQDTNISHLTAVATRKRLHPLGNLIFSEM